jgi:hypothetical protein
MPLMIEPVMVGIGGLPASSTVTNVEIALVTFSLIRVRNRRALGSAAALVDQALGLGRP